MQRGAITGLGFYLLDLQLHGGVDEFLFLHSWLDWSASQSILQNPIQEVIGTFTRKVHHIHVHDLRRVGRHSPKWLGCVAHPT